MAIVYIHLKKTDRSIFYVGIGTEEKRAYCKYQRRPIWDRIVKKYGYIVEIVCRDITWDAACKIEQFLIKQYGRIDNETGILANMTDGGDGTLGQLASKETREKQRKAKTGSRLRLGAILSQETKDKISKSLSGRKIPREIVEKAIVSRKAGNHLPPMLGKKQTEEGKRKISESLRGKPSRNKGKVQTEAQREVKRQTSLQMWAKRKNNKQISNRL